ncbi:uncharacterized protein PV07_10462 [Cladophialophora immunda]|uniref:Uncharacterized protein n=1 Tax=Cladophialophora immunda TaxID=569365 RepID=A0A0D2CMH4_9EURO|nr:uncharacterized protein PV07_10462 [Cladophialophora immunda]KIW24769.1 hypothetical protein PV07_10462 [Cladophialophora immunda]
MTVYRQNTTPNGRYRRDTQGTSPRFMDSSKCCWPSHMRRRWRVWHKRIGQRATNGAISGWLWLLLDELWCISESLVSRTPEMLLGRKCHSFRPRRATAAIIDLCMGESNIVVAMLWLICSTIIDDLVSKWDT